MWKYVHVYIFSSFLHLLPITVSWRFLKIPSIMLLWSLKYFWKLSELNDLDLTNRVWMSTTSNLNMIPGKVLLLFPFYWDNAEYVFSSMYNFREYYMHIIVLEVRRRDTSRHCITIFRWFPHSTDFKKSFLKIILKMYYLQSIKYTLV